LTFVPSFQKKTAAGFCLAAVWNFFYLELQLFHGQASCGDANYDVANYYFANDDHVHDYCAKCLIQ
jgi:hypothetical protein